MACNWQLSLACCRCPGEHKQLCDICQSRKSTFLLVLSCRHKTPCRLLGGTQSVVRCLFRHAKVCGGHTRARPVLSLSQYLDVQIDLRLCAAATRDPALFPRTLTLASDHHPACHFECSGKASLDRRSTCSQISVVSSGTFLCISSHCVPELCRSLLFSYKDASQTHTA